jgi:hypothetical protein
VCYRKRRKGEYIARRHNIGSREQLTPEELSEVRRRLGAMSAYELEAFYRATLNACRYEAGRLPCPRVMQELVQAWKQLRKGAKR